MMAFLGYFAAFFMGASLGLVGGGGSLLTVPVLVYLMGVPATEATSESLFVVGMVSMVGAMHSIRRGQLSYRTALLFALPGFTAVALTRHFLVPRLPNVLFTLHGRDLTGDVAFAVSLAGGVLLAAFMLLRSEMKSHPGAGRVVALMLPAAATVFLLRQFAIPNLPEHLIQLPNFTLTRDHGLMLLFAAVMFAAAYAMLKGPMAGDDGAEQGGPGGPEWEGGLARLLMQGWIVGMVTGLVGAGGGFLIVPALVLFARLPMRRAVGTSLLIITINSLVGFASQSLRHPPAWDRLLPFTGLAILGIWTGSRFADRLPGRTLRRGFAYGVIALALGIVAREMF